MYMAKHNDQHVDSGKSNRHRSLWVFSLVLLFASFLLAFPTMDTASQYMSEEILKYGDSYISFLLPVMLISFSIQFWLFNKRRWLCWLLPVCSAILIAAAELYWMQDGWEALGSGFLWVLGFPMMLGSGMAVLLSVLHRQNRSIQLIVALLMAAVVMIGVVFWPRHLHKKIEILPEAKMLYFEQGDSFEWMQIKNREKIMELLNWVKVTPCLSAPDWDDERGIMLRLNESYILIAPHHDTPYIYEYAGELESFDGGGPKWMVFAYPALYGEIRTSAK